MSRHELDDIIKDALKDYCRSKNFSQNTLIVIPHASNEDIVQYHIRGAEYFDVCEIGDHLKRNLGRSFLKIYSANESCLILSVSVTTYAKELKKAVTYFKKWYNNNDDDDNDDGDQTSYYVPPHNIDEEMGISYDYNAIQSKDTNDTDDTNDNNDKNDKNDTEEKRARRVMYVLRGMLFIVCVAGVYYTNFTESITYCNRPDL